MGASSESEVLAQELSNIAAEVGALESRLKDVEAVINRLESAAETTARALEEVSAHWDALLPKPSRDRKVLHPDLGCAVSVTPTLLVSSFCTRSSSAACVSGASVVG